MSNQSAKLILVRHGESTYNALNQFTGAVDVSLTENGQQQARQCSQLLQDIRIDHIFHSKQQRAIDTCALITHGLGISSAPCSSDASLNERDYGKLNGMNNTQASSQYGTEQVKTWRRSFGACPPEGESLEQTSLRAIRYYNQAIYPLLMQSKNTLVVAHGNSIRGLLFDLLNLTSDSITQVEIGWCEPWIITFRQNHPCRLDILLRETTGKQSTIPESVLSIPVASHQLHSREQENTQALEDLISYV